MATTVSLKPNAVEISGSTSGTTTLQATAVAGTTTLTLPAATDTLVGKATTDTLTNKTLTGAVMNGTLGATTPSTVAATTISASSTATFAAGAVGTPSITTSGDTNTGIFFPAADTIAFAEGGVESMRIDSSGNLGIGTSSPGVKLETSTARSATVTSAIFGQTGTGVVNDVNKITLKVQNTLSGSTGGSGIGAILEASASNKTALGFYYDSGSGSQTEAARIDSSGNLLVGGTNSDPVATNSVGSSLESAGSGKFSRNGNPGVDVNRITDDGELVRFYQAGTQEGNISVSGTTVSYNGGHLARYTQLTTSEKDDNLLKGTVLSNLDEMCVYTNKTTGEPVDNEQLNKTKVSDVEGDVNIAGVFVSWIKDEQNDVEEMNMAMTGDMIIRIAQGTTVARGDLLMSAGDGTAKPQGDDIVRSKTVAKVTSNHVTCTYADGSYCVPCVVMAC